jgi:hypothetical protein
MPASLRPTDLKPVDRWAKLAGGLQVRINDVSPRPRSLDPEFVQTPTRFRPTWKLSPNGGRDLITRRREQTNLDERLNRTQEVVGSIPISSISYCRT